MGNEINCDSAVYFDNALVAHDLSCELPLSTYIIYVNVSDTARPVSALVSRGSPRRLLQHFL